MEGEVKNPTQDIKPLKLFKLFIDNDIIYQITDSNRTLFERIKREILP